ncbi:MAG: hypothetical protein WCL08_12475 [Verrucomicrobiota bacterium]
MGNPLANGPTSSPTPSTSSKTSPSKAGKFKVSQKPVLEAVSVAHTDGPFADGHGIPAQAGSKNGSNGSASSGASSASGNLGGSSSAVAEQSPVYHENFGALPDTYHEDTLF